MYQCMNNYSFFYFSRTVPLCLRQHGLMILVWITSSDLHRALTFITVKNFIMILNVFCILTGLHIQHRRLTDEYNLHHAFTFHEISKGFVKCSAQFSNVMFKCSVECISSIFMGVLVTWEFFITGFSKYRIRFFFYSV